MYFNSKENCARVGAIRTYMRAGAGNMQPGDELKPIIPLPFSLPLSLSLAHPNNFPSSRLPLLPTYSRTINPQPIPIYNS